MAVMLWVCSPGLALPDSQLKSDEEVLFFPQSGWWDRWENVWRIPIHGWVFEREQDSLWRHATVESVAAMLGIEGEVGNKELLKQRAWPFLVDNERNKQITIQYLRKRVTLGPSVENGHFEGILSLDGAALKHATGLPWVKFEVVMPAGTEGRFQGSAQLLCPHGISVISDIDDTIKISNVLDKEELLANTFLRDYRAVPSISAVYGKWSEQGAAFHYVSGSPWQLYSPLAAFLSENGFPRGSFHLRPFRLKDSSFLNLFASSALFKIPVIENILRTYPERRFVLVGDSGEEDPEVYGEMARRYPQQVMRVYIRNVTGESRQSERLLTAFLGVAEGKWRLFRDAQALLRLSLPESGVDAKGPFECK